MENSIKQSFLEIKKEGLSRLVKVRTKNLMTTKQVKTIKQNDLIISTKEAANASK